MSNCPFNIRSLLYHKYHLCVLFRVFILFVYYSRMQALQGCGTSGKSLLTETLSGCMRGEPGTHLLTYSQSSCVASPVSVNSSCESEYSSPPYSPSDQQLQSFASGQCRQHSRANVAYQHTVEVDIDTGLTTLVFCVVSLL